MKHYFGARALHRFDQRRQLANIAANNRQLPAENFLQVRKIRLQVEESHFIAAFDQLFRRVGTNQTTTGN